MEFRKMVMITLYARQQKRHRCIKQSFGFCGRRRGWDDLGEWHWNMPVQVRWTILDAWGWCTGTTQRDGTGKEEGGFRMANTCIPVADSCWYMAKPIQYCKVKKFLKKITHTKKAIWKFSNNLELRLFEVCRKHTIFLITHRERIMYSCIPT